MKQFRIKIKAVVKSNERFLIAKKWYDDRIVSPYQWEFLDGEMEFGETPAAAAERIVREKTQLEVSNGRSLYTWSYVVGDICNVGICFVFEEATGEVFLSEDLLDYCYASREELNDSEHPMNERLLGDFLDNV